MRITTLTAGKGWHVRDLARAAAARGDELTACDWRDLVGGVGAGTAIATARGVALDDTDLVLLRTMPPGSLEQIVFRMDLLQRLEGLGVRVLNPPRAIEAAVDKYLALARMEAAGVPVPPTIVCQRFADAMEAFERLGRDAVLKPIFGSEGFGLMRLSDPDLAARAFAALERMGSVMYVQRYVDHGGTDYRLFVLGDRVLATMRRQSTNGDWRTNVARGGRGESVATEPCLAELAVRATAACGARVAGVDIALEGGDRPFVLEVNAVPGWRELARVTRIDVAAEVLAYAAR